jgi:hypothetical protein
MYAFVFFMSDPLSAILFPEDRAKFLASPLGWAPAVLSITVALVVAAVTLNRRIAGATMVAIGLAFEVVTTRAVSDPSSSAAPKKMKTLPPRYSGFRSDTDPR